MKNWSLELPKRQNKKKEVSFALKVKYYKTPPIFLLFIFFGSCLS